jgi:hypothetical protein
MRQAKVIQVESDDVWDLISGDLSIWDEVSEELSVWDRVRELETV